MSASSPTQHRLCRARRWTLPLVVMLVVSCAAPEEEPPCADEQVQDAAGLCVPAHCGLGRWASLAPGPPNTLFVDPESSQGDGTRSAPLPSIDQALERARTAQGTTRVLLAAGTYPGNLTFDSDLDGLELVGRCPELVTLDGRAGEAESRPGLKVEMTRSSKLTVRGLTVRGGTIGLELRAGKLIGEDLLFLENLALSIGVVFNDSLLILTDSEIRESRALDNGTFGRGLELMAGADARLQRVRVFDTWNEAVLVGDSGSVLECEDLWIRGLREPDGVREADGLLVQDSGQANCTGVLVEEVTGSAVLALGPTARATLSGVEVRAIHAPQSPGVAFGLTVREGAWMQCSDCLVHSVAGFAASAPGGTEGEGGTLILIDNQITNLWQPADFPSSLELNAAGGSTLEMIGGELVSRSQIGAFVQEVGTTLTLRDLRMTGGNSPDPADVQLGIAARQGAEVVLERVDLVDWNGAAFLVTDPGTSLWGRDTTVVGTRAASTQSLGVGGVISEGATGDIAGLHFDNNAGVSLLVEGPGTEVTLSDSTLEQTRTDATRSSGQGLVVQREALFTGNRLVIRDNESSGLYVTSEARVTLEESEFTGNAVAGAASLDGHLILRGGTVSDSHPGLADGGGVGVYVAAVNWAPSLEMEGVSLSDNALASVYIDGPGSYQLRDNLFGASPGVLIQDRWVANGNALYAVGGVSSWDGTEGLLYEGNAHAGQIGPQVLLDGSAASLSNNDWQAQTRAVVQQGCADRPGPVVNLDAGDLDLDECPPHEWVAMPLRYQVWIGEVDIEF